MNLSQWLTEATSASQWGDAIQWTPGVWVKTELAICSDIWCLKDSIRVSGLTLDDTYVFTVVKSADGTTGLPAVADMVVNGMH